MAVKVYILYCGGWGYKPKANKVCQEIEKAFKGEEIEYEMEATPGVTGYMEISVNGKLIHSKKNGDGYVDSDAKMKKIIDAVGAALKG